MAGVSAGEQYDLTRALEPGHSVEGELKKERGLREEGQL